MSLCVLKHSAQEHHIVSKKHTQDTGSNDHQRATASRSIIPSSQKYARFLRRRVAREITKQNNDAMTLRLNYAWQVSAIMGLIMESPTNTELSSLFLCRAHTQLLLSHFLRILIALRRSLGLVQGCKY